MAAQVTQAKKQAAKKDVMRGRLEKRSSDGSWKAHNFYVHGTILCYYLEDQDGVEDAPHASMNLLSVESVDTKVKDDVKLVQLWIDRDAKKKIQLRAAPKRSAGDPPIEKWEQGFAAFIEQARKNGMRAKYLDDRKPKSRARRASDAMVTALWGPEKDPQANLNELARIAIVDFYTEHAPEKIAGVDALIAKYKATGVEAPTLLTAIKKKYQKYDV